MTNLTLEDLPVEGNIYARFAVLQRSESRYVWVVRGHAAEFDMAYYMACHVGFKYPVRIVQQHGDGILSVVRSWN